MPGLLLLPTAFEAERLPAPLRRRCAAQDWPIALCGFGPIVAAARTAALLEAHQPSHVILLGIAGTYSSRYPVASATAFGQVACWGVGVGDGEQHQTASQLGWAQWDAEQPDQRIEDVLPLWSASEPAAFRPTLLTCPAGASSPAEATIRQARFPQAVGEDMEGFAVAVACHLAHVPLQIIRGFSNEAGNRDHTTWKIAPALEAAAAVAEQIVVAS